MFFLKNKSQEGYPDMFFNECIDQDNVSFVQKNASIMPVFNKAYRTSVDNFKKLPCNHNNPFYRRTYI